MATVLQHGIAVGAVLALACGDSGDRPAAGDAAEVRRVARGPVDACALLTQPEAEAILGKPIAAPEPGPGGQCRYAASGGQGEIMLDVVPREFGSEREFHAFLVEQTESMNRRIKEGLKDMGAESKAATVDPAPEVGAPAYYVDPTLIVLKGGRVLSILAADRPQAAAVAAKVLPRF